LRIYNAFFENGYSLVKIGHFSKYSEAPSRKNEYLITLYITIYTTERENQGLFNDGARIFH